MREIKENLSVSNCATALTGYRATLYCGFNRDLIEPCYRSSIGYLSDFTDEDTVSLVQLL